MSAATGREVAQSRHVERERAGSGARPELQSPAAIHHRDVGAHQHGVELDLAVARAQRHVERRHPNATDAAERVHRPADGAEARAVGVEGQREPGLDACRRRRCRPVHRARCSTVSVPSVVIAVRPEGGARLGVRRAAASYRTGRRRASRPAPRRTLARTFAATFRPLTRASSAPPVSSAWFTRDGCKATAPASRAGCRASRPRRSAVKVVLRSVLRSERPSSAPRSIAVRRPSRTR